jgi:hypothetical protein
MPGYPQSDIAMAIQGDAFADYYKMSLLFPDGDEKQLELLKNLDKMYGSTIHCALSCADGYIEIQSNYNNLMSGYDHILPCSNEGLKYVSADAILVGNGAMSGTAFTKLIKEFITSEPKLKKYLDQALKREFDESLDLNLAMSMIEPLVNSIKGDMLMAINNLGENKQDACAVIDVTNNSIVNFVGMTLAASSDVKAIDENNYSVNIDGINAYFGQKEGVAYASTPGQLKEQSNPATNASWFSEVSGSYGYTVANISSLLKDKDVYNYAQSTIESFGVSSSDASKILNSLDFIVYKMPTKESLSLRISFKNKSKNALAQIVDMIPISEEVDF